MRADLFGIGELRRQSNHAGFSVSAITAVGAVLLMVISSTVALADVPSEDHSNNSREGFSPRPDSYSEVNYTQGALVGGGGYGDAFDSNNDSFYVENGSNQLSVVSEASWTTRATISIVGGEYAHVAIDPEHELGFVNAGTSNYFTMFNSSTLVVKKSMATEGGNYVVLDTLHEIAMFDNGGGVSFFNYSSWKYIYNLSVSGGGANALAFDQAAGTLGVVYGTSLGIYNETSNTWVGNASISNGPIGVAFDPTSGDMVVGDATEVTLVHLPYPFVESNYSLPAGENVLGVAIVNGGHDEALLWEYYNTAGAALLPFDISRHTFLPQIEYSQNAWPAGIAIDPKTLDALAVDPLESADVPYIPTLVSQYVVGFNESGLAAGTNWCVTLNSTKSCSTSNWVYFTEANGHYSYSVGNVSGYSVSPLTGTVNVASAAVNVAVTYTPLVIQKFSVAFNETGLPAGTNWSVTLGSTLRSSSTAKIAFSEPNGTYKFKLTQIPGYTVSPFNGTITVNGALVNQSEKFTVRPASKYPVNFTENGLPSGTSWSVNLSKKGTTNGTNTSSSTSSISFSEVNGTYAYKVGAVAGYYSTPSSGNVTVNGSAAPVPITFTKKGTVTYNVTFNETGLPSGTTWSVTLNGSTLKSAASSITFAEKSGAYNFSVPSVGSYSSNLPSGSLTVSKSNCYVNVVFTKGVSYYTVTFAEAGLPTGTNWSVRLNHTTILTGATDIFFNEVNGNYSFVVSNVSGYTVNPGTGSVAVSGGNKTVNVTFARIVILTYYNVTFAETGLPNGTAWSVNLNGVLKGAAAPATINYTELNGTYTYDVISVNGYTETPSSGYSFVYGAQAYANITFTKIPPKYALNFVEMGLPSLTEWSMDLNGTLNISRTSDISFYVENGSYSYAVGFITGYVTSPTSGIEVVSGKAMEVNITFSPTYTVSFVEGGLPLSTEWSVTLDNLTHEATTATIEFTIGAGTWLYTINSVRGYTANITVGFADVSGKAQTVQVTFSLNSTSSGSSGLSILSGGPDFDLIWLGAIVAAGIVSVLFTRPKKTAQQ